MYELMADPSTAEGRALLTAESPLSRAKAIIAPLMVVQGRNDPRVKIRESNQIVAAVRDDGGHVEYLVAADEGHGFVRPINNLALVTAMEAFFGKYLGGRYQADVPSEVEAKLKEMTVDPTTVDATAMAAGH
jgi:dipeptidyl aminopeptidase/acylaminoacyl peptidase